MTPSRPWWLALFITAGALALVAFFAIVVILSPLKSSPLATSLSYSALVDGGFVFPGLVISMALNGIILWRRRPPVVRRADRTALIVVYAILAAVIVEGVIESIAVGGDVDQFGPVVLLAVPLWLCLIVASIVALVVLISGNSRVNLSAGTAEIGDPSKTFGPVEP